MHCCKKSVLGARQRYVRPVHFFSRSALLTAVYRRSHSTTTSGAGRLPVPEAYPPRYRKTTHLISSVSTVLTSETQGYANTPYTWSPHVVDIQLLRVGNLVMLVIPGELTTMAGRRLRYVLS